MTPATVSEEMEKMIILGQIREKPRLSDSLMSLFPIHIKQRLWNKKHSSQLIFELYTKKLIEVKRINHQNRFVVTASGERYFQQYSEAFKLLYLRYFDNKTPGSGIEPDFISATAFKVPNSTENN